MPTAAEMTISQIGCKLLPLTFISDMLNKNTKRHVPIMSNCTVSCERTLDIPKSVDSTNPTNTASKSPVTVERTYTKTLCTAGFLIKFEKIRAIKVMIIKEGRTTPNVAQIAPSMLSPTPADCNTDTPV